MKNKPYWPQRSSLGLYPTVTTVWIVEGNAVVVGVAAPPAAAMDRKTALHMIEKRMENSPYWPRHVIHWEGTNTVDAKIVARCGPKTVTATKVNVMNYIPPAREVRHE